MPGQQGGRTGFLKRSADVDPRWYAVEAAGLRWLRDAGGTAVVEVLEVGEDFLHLEQLVAARPTRSAASAFGESLHRTHRAGAEAFGAPPPGVSGTGFIGRQPMSLTPHRHWGTFYAEQRLLPYARAARDRGNLSAAGATAVDRVVERLVDGAFDDDQPPARLHGDLWAGNVMWTGSGVVLIDPAAHGGHALTDLAMLDLFGTPELPAVLDAYAAAAGLACGWRSLLGLHQLHPLLVHAVSHGAAYGAQAARVARRYAG